MPTTLPLVVFFILGFILGCALSYRLLTRSRRTVTEPNILYQWSGGRLSSWRYERHTSLAIMVHTIGVAALGAAGLFAAQKPSSWWNALLADDATMVGLLWFAQCGSMALTGYMLGALVAFPLARLEKKPVAYGLGEVGLAYGRSLMQWSWFSHFTLDREQRLFRFYSAFAPDLPSYMIMLPDAPRLEELAAVVSSHLPQQPPTGRLAWYRTKNMLVPAMLLLCLLFVGLGWLATLLPRELALFVIALCTSLLAALGGQLVALYGFGTLKSGEKKSKGQ